MVYRIWDDSYKMTYNIAFDRRVTRGELIEQVGLSAGELLGIYAN